MGRDASTQHAYAVAVVDRVAALLARRAGTAREPLLIGLSGQLVGTLNLSGVPALAMSLDDFYLGRRERARLARDVHPLLATRGVPGTHDLELIARTLGALAAASGREPARVPRFDKGRDTRMPRARWRIVRDAPRVILFEG